MLCAGLWRVNENAAALESSKDICQEMFMQRFIAAMFTLVGVFTQLADAKSFVYASVVGENRIAIYEKRTCWPVAGYEKR